MNTIGLARAAALTAAALWLSGCDAQWSFELDTTFRTTIVDQNVNALHILQDGKIFLSGRMRFPGDMNVRSSARLFSSGQRDLTFPTFPQTTGGEKILPWFNGKFYVSNGLPRRMLQDGLIDPSFGPLGIGPYFQPSTTGDYHVFPDGRVLISGSHLLSDSIRGFEGYYELIWFTNTGYLDTTRTHRNANGPIWEFKELPDGKFICSCSCTQYEGQPVSRLFRVHADGALDTSFQSDVVLGNIYEFEAMDNGSIWVGGNYRRSVVPQDTIRLARFLANGSFDPSFAELEFGGNPSWWPWFGTQVFDIFPFRPDRYIIAGQFTTVNGQPRGGLCMIDSSGNLLPELDDFYVGPFTYQTTTNAGFTNVYWNQDSTAIYVCGAYAGCNDGTINDTQQRFVSRLLVTELTTGVEGREQAMFRLYPNPATGPATLEMEGIPHDTELVLRDVLGRELLRQRIRDQYTTLQLQHLPDGCYNLEIREGVRRLAHQRLVVQH
jgi:hypothetical protein